MHETELWVGQANTPWTGVELAFASLLLYEGFYDESLGVIKEVDTRYRRAGLYWDHQEFGGHYYRPMSSWQIVNALLGLSINRGRYSFSPKLQAKTFKLFFAFDAGTAHFEQRADAVAVHIRSGSFKPQVMELPVKAVATASPKVSVGERAIQAQIEREGDRLRIILPQGFEAQAG